MIPLVFMDHAPALGGAEHSLLLILKHLDRARWQPHLICVDGPLADQVPLPAAQVWRIKFPRLRGALVFRMDWWRGVRQIRTIVQQTQSQIIYANTVRAAFYGSLAARCSGRPFIWHLREFWLSENEPRFRFLDRLLKRWIGSLATRVITNSQATADRLPFRKNVVVIHNALDLVSFSTEISSFQFRQTYQIPAAAPVVGMLGRLRPLKGQDRFLRMVAQVAKVIPDAHFLVVGGTIFETQDDYEQRLYQLAAALGISQRVVFTGQLSDIRAALACMDLLVSPGEPEAFGLVNIEAMALGKPVVAFNHGALPEIVVDGETGLLVPPGDEAALAQAVIDLLRDPPRREQFGAAGRERVAAYFTAERLLAELEQVLQEVLAA